MNDFYLTLPSDSSIGMFPDNSRSTYRTHLTPPIHFNHQEWEVGLSALAFPTDWYNLTEKDNKLRLKVFPWKIVPGMETMSDKWLEPPECTTVPNNDEGSTEVETHMETNTYRNVEQLLNVLNVTMHGLWKCNEIQEIIHRKPFRLDPNIKELTPLEKSEQEEYENRMKLSNQAEKQPYATFKLDSLNQRIYLSFDSSDAVNFLRMLPAISFQIEGPMVGMLGWPDFSQEFQLDKLCRRNIRDAKITAPFQPAVDMAFDMFYLCENLLSFGRGAKNNQLNQQVMWEKDTTDQLDSTQAVQTGAGDAIVPVVNHGLGERRKKMGESSEFELQSRLHVDLCLQDRYLIDGVDVRIQLERQQPKFYLMWNENNETYKVELIKAYLEVPFVTLAPSTYTRIAEQLQSNNAKYPLKRVVVKDISIPSRRRFHVLDNLFINEVLPKRLILGLVENDSYDGNSIKNPFKFHHHRLEYIKLMKNGDVVEEYFMDFPNKQATTPYLDLMKRVGILNSKEDLDMSYNDYIKGCTLFGFDLTSEQIKSNFTPSRLEVCLWN
ncbi:hypothetical protein LOTGIDRAFT_155057 [Lottia gigantea]|uniref:Uncharacterized protein n=1 Tax=Lottia gigantea TaxID=225164 RepID=V3Z4G3_LOTGI|nr:hypothetical protein LOTGIDRAFT_155057 [Lottia gigantea]ESO85568.1 hypothetical protein LOTGIDRAFT_155057 [Lottia gigantea]